MVVARWWSTFLVERHYFGSALFWLGTLGTLNAVLGSRYTQCRFGGSVRLMPFWGLSTLLMTFWGLSILNSVLNVGARYTFDAVLRARCT